MEREPDRIGRAARASVDVGVGYGLALGKAMLRAGIGVAKAGTDVAMKVLEQGPVGDAAGAVADRLEPAAERGRRQREATAEEVEAVIGRVVDEVVAVINVDGIIQQVDVDGIVKRVDVNGIVGRVDIDDIISQVDIDGIVRRTEVGTLIVQSTGGIVTQMLDFVRSLAVSMDRGTEHVTDRVLHHGRPRPVAPPLLVAGELEPTEVLVVEAALS